MYPKIYVIGSSNRAIRSNILRTWNSMPDIVRDRVGRVVQRIVVIPSKEHAYRAALVGNTLTLTDNPEELWHEVGHILVSVLSPRELDVAVGLRSASETLPISEALSEDFYFMMKNSKRSPFWSWWLENQDREDNMEKKAADISPLDIVEGALEKLADLVFESNNEEMVWVYGIALQALSDARKNDMLAYEDRKGTHQYYYPEDLEKGNGRIPAVPMIRPLEVDRPDMTVRHDRDKSLGVV